MTVSDELFDMIKLFRSKRYQDLEKKDLYNPANLWCMWIKKDSQTWKNFVVWYLNDSLETLEKSNDNFWSYFTSNKNNIKEFANEWVVEAERNDFYKFCINMIRNQELRSNIHCYA
ncbi:MAG: hypothetical protein E3K37_11200 [Candidatus Kuenenia sp.]|nr:hypothetical protein [Candidatus Kuenenia hertensis]